MCEVGQITQFYVRECLQSGALVKILVIPDLSTHGYLHRDIVGFESSEFG